LSHFFRSITSAFWSLTGVEKFLTIWKEQSALCALLVICLALTVVWMVRLIPKQTASVSKTFGRFLLGFIKLAVTLSAAMVIMQFILGIAIGSLVMIPIIFLTIFIVIALGFYVLKNTTGMFKTMKPCDWRADKGGLEGVKWLYVITTCAVLGWLICHPSLNSHVYFIPAILSGALGIFAQIWSTVYGTKVTAKQTTQIEDELEGSNESSKILTTGRVRISAVEGELLQNAEAEVLRGNDPKDPPTT